MQFEKPEDAEDWLARITVILLVTAIISLPIVGGVMWLLIDAPTWSLAVAVAVILVLTTMLAFAPDAEESEPEPDNSYWKRADRPTSVVGWAKRIGMIWLTWSGMGVVVNILILGLVFDASDTVKGIAAILLLPLAILVETFDLVEDDPEQPERRDRQSTTTDAVARQTYE